jgi:hypothetical protein
MKTMKDITSMKDAELTTFLAEEREAARKHRFETGARDVRAIRAAKKNVARAMTEITRRNAATA